jgi:hypothetical protein
MGKEVKPTPGKQISIERNKTKGFRADNPLILKFFDTTAPVNAVTA